MQQRRGVVDSERGECGWALQKQGRWFSSKFSSMITQDLHTGDAHTGPLVVRLHIESSLPRKRYHHHLHITALFCPSTEQSHLVVLAETTSWVILGENFSVCVRVEN